MKRFNEQAGSNKFVLASLQRQLYNKYKRRSMMHFISSFKFFLFSVFNIYLLHCLDEEPTEQNNPATVDHRQLAKSLLKLQKPLNYITMYISED